MYLDDTIPQWGSRLHFKSYWTLEREMKVVQAKEIVDLVRHPHNVESQTFGEGGTKLPESGCLEVEANSPAGSERGHE